jgi:hypothetical protein
MVDAARPDYDGLFSMPELVNAAGSLHDAEVHLG